jgi:hypothetical protein
MAPGHGAIRLCRACAWRGGMREFPFSVGQTLGKSMGIYTAIVVVLVAAVYLLWHLGRKQKPVPA